MPSTGSVTVSGEWVGIDELLLQMRGIPGLGQGCDGKIDGQRLFARSNPRSSDAHFQHVDPFTQVQCLVNPANAGAAVHAVNPKRKLCQFGPRLCLMIRPERRCRAPAAMPADYYWMNRLSLNR